jgi:terminase large subunit-like protein
MTETMYPCAEPIGQLQTAKAKTVYDMLRRMRPRSREDLRNYVKVFLGIDVPDTNLCPDHSSPMDYLWHSFSVDFGLAPVDCIVGANHHSPLPGRNADAIVWANRAGGKTELAAVATLLDGLFKPNCQIRILGGSGEQSSRMYEYLTTFLQRGFEGALAGPVRKGSCRFANGAGVEVLTQSATSVRGQHVQKLRCDEVELFDEEVFAAAKFTTLSKDNLTAAMELISTMHRPYGIMQREVAAAADAGAALFKWCLWETIEKCIGRTCSQCPLWIDCQGRAKRAAGYLRIDDCITQMRRSSRAGWEAEMLCIRPSLENVVLGEFDPDIHVKPVDYDPNLPLYRALDFGFVNPFVCLWIQVDNDGTVRVIDEYVRRRATIDVHAQQVQKRTPCAEEQVAATFCDPAGAGASDITGTSVVRELRSLGIATRYRKSGIVEGIELIRRAIRTGDGQSKLMVSPRCCRLVEAMQCYHYPDGGRAGQGELPFKDGLYDHPIDALRYFFVNHKHSTKATTRRY